MAMSEAEMMPATIDTPSTRRRPLRSATNAAPKARTVPMRVMAELNPCAEVSRSNSSAA